MPSDVQEGWDNHELQKSLRKMAEDADWPEEVYRVIVPDEDAASLFALLVDEDITVLGERDADTLAVYGREGNLRTTIPNGSEKRDGTLDLRIGQ